MAASPLARPRPFGGERFLSQAYKYPEDKSGKVISGRSEVNLSQHPTLYRCSSLRRRPVHRSKPADPGTVQKPSRQMSQCRSFRVPKDRAGLVGEGRGRCLSSGSVTAEPDSGGSDGVSLSICTSTPSTQIYSSILSMSPTYPKPEELLSAASWNLVRPPR